MATLKLTLTGTTPLLVLGNAGRYVGVGDWRPACGGTYGRFNVEVAG